MVKPIKGSPKVAITAVDELTEFMTVSKTSSPFKPISALDLYVPQTKKLHLHLAFLQILQDSSSFHDRNYHFDHM
jgi:hypothetical protein